ncbi:hypothetical protein [Rhizobium sp. L245/93]|uniref:hypothetical protein n=1 Tax=Rhizobium sp. L245/93 TaxID=2819998 RepID=UPI001ADCCF3F|nr:hypothetical protein [Rhizobium sp. L245/93]MBO9168343.1 hypothetical protein [Rhizobium sp. L245/93]
MTTESRNMFTGTSPRNGKKYLKGVPLKMLAETLAMGVASAEKPDSWQPQMPRADRVLMIIQSVEEKLNEAIPDAAVSEEFAKEFVDQFLAALPPAPPGEDTLLNLAAALARLID